MNLPNFLAPAPPFVMEGHKGTLRQSPGDYGFMLDCTCGRHEKIEETRLAGVVSANYALRMVFTDHLENVYEAQRYLAKWGGALPYAPQRIV